MRCLIFQQPNSVKVMRTYFENLLFKDTSSEATSGVPILTQTKANVMRSTREIFRNVIPRTKSSELLEDETI